MENVCIAVKQTRSKTVFSFFFAISQTDNVCMLFDFEYLFYLQLIAKQNECYFYKNSLCIYPSIHPSINDGIIFRENGRNKDYSIGKKIWNKNRNFNDQIMVIMESNHLR